MAASESSGRIHSIDSRWGQCDKGHAPPVGRDGEPPIPPLPRLPETAALRAAGSTSIHRHVGYRWRRNCRAAVRALTANRPATAIQTRWPVRASAGSCGTAFRRPTAAIHFSSLSVAAFCQRSSGSLANTSRRRAQRERCGRLDGGDERPIVLHDGRDHARGRLPRRPCDPSPSRRYRAQAKMSVRSSDSLPSSCSGARYCSVQAPCPEDQLLTYG